MQLPERMSILSSNLESQGGSNFFCSMRVMACELNSCNEGCRRSRKSRRGGSSRKLRRGGFRMPDASPKEFPSLVSGISKKDEIRGSERLNQVDLRIGRPFRQAV